MSRLFDFEARKYRLFCEDLLEESATPQAMRFGASVKAMEFYILQVNNGKR
jgi:hypothetical protein